MAEENKSNGLAWFLAGLGVGALVGILYAPKSGRETREELIAGAKEGTEYLRNRTRHAAEQVGDLVEKSKEQVSEYVERLVSEQSGRVGAAVEAGRQAYNTPPGADEPKDV
jgi:gas vesicle protein